MRLVIFILLFCSTAFSQCNGTQSFTLTPMPVAGTYLPGQTVTACYTMTGYTQAGTNWIEGFDLTLGAGWASVAPQTAPANCGGNATGGQWTWMTSVTSTTTPITTVGPGYFFDLNIDGNPGNDFGDAGNCTWTFCVTLTVANACTPQSLLLQVTPGSDGVWGSYNSSTCDAVTPFTVLGAIQHN
jgi:predicted small secreted protein